LENVYKSQSLITLMVKIPDYVLVSRKKNPIYVPTLFKNVDMEMNGFFGNSPPQIFIGSKLTYPKVNVGILSPSTIVENSWEYNSQEYWARNNYNIEQIVGLRASLINSRFQTEVKNMNDKFLDIAKEIGIGKNPVDVEIELKKKIKLKFEVDNINMPMGPRAELKKAKITENVRVDNKVEKVINDNDLKASEGINYLYKKGFEDSKLSQLLSLGVLGIKKNRKLVPTRWSITASDDVIGKEITKEIKNFNTIDDYKLFFGNFLGNYYLIMIFPEVFEFELFEMYLPGSSWNQTSVLNISTDYEDYYGRKEYASNTVGGYYSTRLGVLEYLKEARKQASVLVLRFELPEYWASLGVWVVRESVRKALENEFKTFDDKSGMINYARALALRNFKIDINNILVNSKLLKKKKEQMKLKQFI